MRCAHYSALQVGRRVCAGKRFTLARVQEHVAAPSPAPSLENDPLPLQLSPQLVSIVDGTVVHKGDTLAVIQMGVRVLIGLAT